MKHETLGRSKGFALLGLTHDNACYVKSGEFGWGFPARPTEE
jgi:hypothetical protein